MRIHIHADLIRQKIHIQWKWILVGSITLLVSNKKGTIQEQVMVGRNLRQPPAKPLQCWQTGDCPLRRFPSRSFPFRRFTLHNPNPSPIPKP